LSLRLRIDEEREQPAKHCKRIAKKPVDKYSYEEIEKSMPEWWKDE